MKHPPLFIHLHAPSIAKDLGYSAADAQLPSKTQFYPARGPHSWLQVSNSDLHRWRDQHPDLCALGGPEKIPLARNRHAIQHRPVRICRFAEHPSPALTRPDLRISLHHTRRRLSASGRNPRLVREQPRTVVEAGRWNGFAHLTRNLGVAIGSIFIKSQDPRYWLGYGFCLGICAAARACVTILKMS